LRIGLVGFGTVGRGFFDLVEIRKPFLERELRLRMRVAAVLVRDAARPRATAPGSPPFTDDPAAFLGADYDVVVEATGSVDDVAPVLRDLLARGTAVVTANKALVAERGSELARIAGQSGASFRYEASVAAGIPLFQMLERSLRTTRFRRIAAILNGTSNFVLTRLARAEDPSSIDGALSEARGLGFAEPDSGDDVSGADAARKLAILARALTGREVAGDAIEAAGIADVRREDCAAAVAFGHRLKPLAVAELDPEPRGWVAPALVPEGHPLATIELEANAIHLTGDTVPELFVAGPGAGPGPTAAALLDDVLSTLDSRPASRAPAPAADRGLGTAGEVGSPWFLAVTLDPGAVEPRDVVEFVAGAGLPFAEVRRLGAAGGGLTLAGITERATRARVEAARAALTRARGVRGARAFRVLAGEGNR
jgi:homoserine dehydrogenase